MNAIRHDSPNKTNLRYEGLAAGFVRPSFKGPQRFTCKFECLRKIVPWDAKALAMRYLVLEYEAKDFDFFRRANEPVGVFYVTFTSHAL